MATIGPRPGEAGLEPFVTHMGLDQRLPRVLRVVRRRLGAHLARIFWNPLTGGASRAGKVLFFVTAPVPRSASPPR
ncbi:hypothetical protein ACSDR0_28565 [Streptosporangium sp. G11]|uniref:hypothetical protein n=1 Tax=Streptosporangium sp. G11 TaxID=3436926 RepID=UPI003EBFD0AE